MNKVSTLFLSLFTCSLAIVNGTTADAQSMRAIARNTNQYLNDRAEGNNVNGFHRFEVGYAFTYGSGSININDRFRDPSNANVILGNSRSTTFSYRAWSAFAGKYFPLTYLSNTSMLALNVNFMGTGSVWELGNVSLDESSVRIYEAAEVLFGLPIGVDYIFGGEATLNKVDKVTLRAGAGLMPFLAAGSWADDSQKYTRLGIRPYIKAELGFFAGVEWKLKGMVVAGSREIYNIKEGDYRLNESSYYYSLNMKIRPTYSIGLVVFPFSFGWENDKW